MSFRIGDDTEVDQRLTYRGSVFPVNLPPHSFCFVGASVIVLFVVCTCLVLMYRLLVSCCSIALNAYARLYIIQSRNE